MQRHFTNRESFLGSLHLLQPEREISGIFIFLPLPLPKFLFSLLLIFPLFGLHFLYLPPLLPSLYAALTVVYYSRFSPLFSLSGSRAHSFFSTRRFEYKCSDVHMLPHQSDSLPQSLSCSEALWILFFVWGYISNKAADHSSSSVEVSSLHSQNERRSSS